jgi:hypothetical protein
MKKKRNVCIFIFGTKKRQSNFIDIRKRTKFIVVVQINLTVLIVEVNSKNKYSFQSYQNLFIYL